MTARSTARRTRTALAAVAGAALLSMSACGSGPEEGAGNDPEAPIEASDGGSEKGAGGGEADDEGASGDDADTEEPGASEGGADEDDGAGAGTEDGSGEEGASGERTRIMLVTEIPSEDSGDGWPVLAPEELAALLTEPFGGTADCEEELELAPGMTSTCTGPSSMDSTDPEQEWTAQSARIPTEGELGEGGSVAVLFTTGSGLSGPAESLLEESTELTGLGFGSMYGAEDLSAEDLENDTLEVLTSQNAYVRLDDAGWDSVSCEGGLSFDVFEPTPCTATTAEGASYELQVAPGSYVDNDQGLLVGISHDRAG